MPALKKCLPPPRFYPAPLPPYHKKGLAPTNQSVPASGHQVWDALGWGGWGDGRRTVRRASLGWGPGGGWGPAHARPTEWVSVCGGQPGQRVEEQGT